jgi:hypothetical protein
VDMPRGGRQCREARSARGADHGMFDVLRARPGRAPAGRRAR